MSEGATAKVNSVSQQSGVTSNDFTNPVVYQIVAADGTIQNWTVTVQKDASVTAISDPSYFPATMFPMPATDYLNLKLENLSNASIVIYNQLGDKVYLNGISTDNTLINVASFEKGIYLICLEAQGKKWTKVFAKE